MRGLKFVKVHVYCYQVTASGTVLLSNGNTTTKHRYLLQRLPARSVKQKLVHVTESLRKDILKIFSDAALTFPDETTSQQHSQAGFRFACLYFF